MLPPREGPHNNCISLSFVAYLSTLRMAIEIANISYPETYL